MTSQGARCRGERNPEAGGGTNAGVFTPRRHRVPFAGVLCFLAVCGVFSHFREGLPAERRAISCTIGEAVARAKARDLEYERLAYTLGELARSKKNLYRAFFPSFSTGLSGADIVHTAEQDERIYRFNLTVEEVLYNQLSIPFQFRNHGVSLEESHLALKQREIAVSNGVVRVYLDALLGEEMLRTRRDERALYGEYLELVREEYALGMKTMLDVMETEKKTLETELAVEELVSRREILLKDLANLIGAADPGLQIELSSDVNDILAAACGSETIRSFDAACGLVSDKTGGLMDKERLKSASLRNDITLKRNKLLLEQNSLRQRLLALQFLDSLSLRYSVDFIGDRFFPANPIHTLAVNLLLDFGVLSSDVSFGGSSGEALKSRASGAESKVLESLDPLDEGRLLRIEAFTVGKQIERTEDEIAKRIDVWVLKMESLLKRHAIMLKSREIFERNEELLEAKLGTGQARRVDHMEFLIGKSEFLLELETLKYEFISLVWELETLTGIAFADYAR